MFEGPEDYHHRIEDPDLGVEEQSVLIIRNCGPVGYPGQCRGGEHAAAGIAAEARHNDTADHG